MRNAEHQREGRPTCSAFRLPRSAFVMTRKQRRAERETSAGGVVSRRGGDGPGPRARPDRASGTRRGEAGRGRGMTPPLVPVFHPRREARRAVRQGYPRGAGVVRLCRSLAGVERLLYSRLVDAVVLDVKAAPA